MIKQMKEYKESKVVASTGFALIRSQAKTLGF